jgi:hypothetical protein
LLRSVALLLVAVVAVALLGRAWARAPQALTHIRPWATVLASLGLLVGATAGLRGRTWGVLLIAGGATSFAGAYALQIAPPWFLGVAVIGWSAVATVVGPMLRFDRRATGLALLLMVTLGAAAACSVGPGLALLTDPR